MMMKFAVLVIIILLLSFLTRSSSKSRTVPSPSLLLLSNTTTTTTATNGRLLHVDDELPYPMPSATTTTTERPPVVASTRSQRFPSVEERTKLYMSNWYLPPCSNYDEGKVQYQYNTHDVHNKNESKSESEYPTLTIYEPQDRSSVDDGNNNTTTTSPKHYVMDSTIEPDKCFFIHRPTLLECATKQKKEKETTSTSTRGDTPSLLSQRITAPKNMYLYCSDVADSVLTAYDHVLWEQQQQEEDRNGEDDEDNTYSIPPLLMQFGDLRHSHVYRFMDIPHIKKFRSATTREEIRRVTTSAMSTPSSATTTQQCIRFRSRDIMRTSHNHTTLQPIIWKLATSRHFRLLYKVHRDDTPWKNKLNMAIFRGQLTGSLDGYDKNLSDEENCYNMRRCRLVYNHANSTFIHAKLTSTRNRMPPILNGVDLMGPSVTIRKLLQFKGIIMLEGNDVASGLKWALLSQSVVLMPVPKHTSWAMEELLIPWVHYIPLNENATDVEEKMQWVVENDDYAQRISERATLWMSDLVFHPDSLEDDRQIQEEIIRRYLLHFSTAAAADINTATTTASSS